MVGELQRINEIKQQILKLKNWVSLIVWDTTVQVSGKQ